MEAKSILLQIDMHFIVMLNIFNNLLCIAKYASYVLQPAKIVLGKALDLINNLVETLQKHRIDNRNGKKLNFYLINVAFTRTLLAFRFPHH